MTPEEEQRRLEAVRGLHQLDSGPEERFDRIAELARQIFGVPMVGINLVEEDRQFAKAGIGLQHVMARRDAFSTQTIEGHGQLLVQDARTDPRFADDPYVRGDPHIRFYAGQPVKAHGETVGALCILDHEPRELSTAESRLLRTLGRWVENELALDHEVLQAREVQRRLLPRSVPDVPGLELAGRCRPAREVGGDFYDHQVLDDGTVQVAIADVMGKGLTAAVIAAGTRAVLRGTSRYNPLPEAVSRTARTMQEDLEASTTFVTLFAARVDPASGDLTYVDAGHGLALVLDQEGRARTLRSTDLPLGTLPDDRWHEHRDRLEQGETLLLISDGVLDAFADVAAAITAAEQVAREALGIEQLVDRVCGLFVESLQPDDVTVVAVRRTAHAATGRGT